MSRNAGSLQQLVDKRVNLAFVFQRRRRNVMRKGYWGLLDVLPLFGVLAEALSCRPASGFSVSLLRATAGFGGSGEDYFDRRFFGRAGRMLRALCWCRF